MREHREPTPRPGGGTSTEEMLDNEMAILAPLQEGMQALPSEEVANEGARALRKVLERFKAKLRDQYLEGKGVDASQAPFRRLRRRTSAPSTPTRHGCLTTLSSDRGNLLPACGGTTSASPASVGGTNLGLTSGLGLRQSGGPDTNAAGWRDGRTSGGNSFPEPWARHCMEISDRPTILPITHDPNLSDKVMYLQMAFKQRPLTRPLSKAAAMGAKICVLTSPWEL